MPGSGKSEVTKYIESKGYKKVYFGQVTFDELGRRGLETNETNEKFVREDLRKQYGMAAFAILNIPKIKVYYSGGSNVVIESLYSWQEYLKIKEEFGDSFKVIAVQASPQIRYGRVAGRVEYQNNVERLFTLDEVASRDKAQIENLATAGPIAMADFTILNNGSKEELHGKVDEVLEKIQQI
ncbi:AAA family ATPase [Candidatus Parcubacteria bacterium]|nr:AAA family ATPase [Candidatus Parcubacteria bacterium]